MSNGSDAASFEYSAQVASPLVNEQATLVVGPDGLAVTATFDAVEVPWVEITSIALADFVVTVQTVAGDYQFSRLGAWTEAFYDALTGAYNRAVLDALFVEGEPSVRAAGDYQLSDAGTSATGSAPVGVYDSAVCVLPPDLGARRVPLCFVTAMDKGDFWLTLRIADPSGVSPDDFYTFAKLGYQTDAFAAAITSQIRAVRQNTVAAVRQIDPSLSATQAAQIAKLMPAGAAAPIGQLAAVAPSFIQAAEEAIGQSLAAETYPILTSLCDPAQIRLGFVEHQSSTPADGAAASLTGGEGGGLTVPNALASLVAAMPNPAEAGEDQATDEAPAEAEDYPYPYVFWLVAPLAQGAVCAVEFAVPKTEAAATFVYRSQDGFDVFAARLNRAMEAVAFAREVISMPDEQVASRENARYQMVIERTPALAFIRQRFAGRVIHTSPQAWEKSLVTYLG